MSQRRIDAIRPLPKLRSEIITAAESLSLRYVQELGDWALLGISFDRFYESVIYPDYGIVLEEDCDLGFDADGSKILGQFEPASNTVYIDASLNRSLQDPRRTFTLYHEVAGHGVLQGEWLRAEFGRISKSGKLTTTEAMLDLKTVNVLERQANLFAAHVAAPRWLLKHAMGAKLKLCCPVAFLGRGQYCVDVGRRTSFYFADTFDDVCRRLALTIQPYFGGLSIEALSYRIAEAGWAVDVSASRFRLHRAERRAPEFSGCP
jgi:hypothetical protein